MRLISIWFWEFMGFGILEKKKIRLNVEYFQARLGIFRKTLKLSIQ